MGALSVLPAFEADFNEDQHVEAAYLAKWKLGFGICSVATRTQCNADGDADVVDFLAWERQLGSSLPVIAHNGQVPEPATSMLFIMATVGICHRAGRMRRELLNA